jgi:hypothetical protein
MATSRILLEKAYLNELFKLFLKPAKIPGVGTNAPLQEVALFVSPAKLMIC